MNYCALLVCSDSSQWGSAQFVFIWVSLLVACVVLLSTIDFSGGDR